jgi:hypothetical protein
MYYETRMSMTLDARAFVITPRPGKNIKIWVKKISNKQKYSNAA